MDYVYCICAPKAIQCIIVNILLVMNESEHKKATTTKTQQHIHNQKKNKVVINQ